ncbi:MAG: hypothetical protein EXS48_00690 [Candidatus Staskawiczbacteria bacterium]|nr:hypothetical protein [Candidatus Staskawiczbacteria bacterium]
MDTILATNILFYTLTIFLVLFAVCVVAVSINVIMIIRVLKREAERIESDIKAVRDKVKNGSMAITSFLVSIASFLNKKDKKSKK